MKDVSEWNKYVPYSKNWQQFLMCPIDQLEVSAQVHRILKQSGLRYVWELLVKSKSEMLKVSGRSKYDKIGPRRLEMINVAVKEVGSRLRCTLYSDGGWVHSTFSDDVWSTIRSLTTLGWSYNFYLADRWTLEGRAYESLMVSSVLPAADSEEAKKLKARLWLLLARSWTNFHSQPR